MVHPGPFVIKKALAYGGSTHRLGTGKEGLP